MANRHDDDDWTPAWGELGDLMRPYSEPTVTVESPKKERERKRGRDLDPIDYNKGVWADEIAKEEREQRRLEKERRRLADSPLKRYKETLDGGESAAALERFRGKPAMRFARHCVPFGLLLLLAPRIGYAIEFNSFPLPYWAVLLTTALPLAALYLWLLPMEDTPFFRFAALCLPLETYFMLSFAGGMSAILPLILLGVGFAALLVYNFFSSTDEINKNKFGAENASEMERAMEFGGRRRLKMLRGVDQAQMKGHYRKLLRFGVLALAALFLVPAALGAAQGASDAEHDRALPVPERTEEPPAPFTIENAMHSIALLDAEHWKELNKGQKERAMQALLDAELHSQLLPPAELADKRYYNLKRREYMSIKQAMSTGNDQTDDRIRAVCCAVYVAKMLGMAEEIDPQVYNDNIARYVDDRAVEYRQRIATYWLNDESNVE